MASAVDYEDLDAEEEQAAASVQQPPDARLLQPIPIPSVGGAATSAAAEDVAKVSGAEQRLLQMDAVKMRDRMYGSIVCALLLIAVASVLAFVTAKMLLATDPEVPYTHVIIRNTHTPFNPLPINATDSINETDIQLASAGDTLLDVDAAESLGLPDVPAAASYFCGTAASKNMAAYLEGLLTSHRDTCSSLYDRVCSSWSRSHRHLAEARGHYSVDDTVMDAVLEQVGRLLSSPEVPLPEQRGFYSDCIAGRLVSEQDLEDITRDLVSLTEERTPGTLAEVIVRMAAIGVSPFFQAFVKNINETFYVNLVNTEDGARKEHSTIDHENSLMNQPNTENIGRVTASPYEEGNDSVEFFHTLERQICLRVTQMAGLNRTCVLLTDSSRPTAWEYEWYASNGPARLAAAIALILEHLSAYHKEIDKMVNSFTTFHITVAPQRERLVRCLRFIDQYDPDLIPHIIKFAPLLEADANDTLSQLKTALYKMMPNAPAIILSLDGAGLSKNASFVYPCSSDLYGQDSVSNASRLRTFLERSTWKRWTGGFTSKASALSFLPMFSENSSSLEIPIGAFNFTTSGDQWLHDLSLARTGPLVFKTLFLGVLSPHLARTRFYKCISEYSKSMRRFNERGFWAVIRNAASFIGYGATPKDSEVQLDMEELASFYASLQAYRARVGEAVAVPGSLFNSDTLFLLYYVFNNCEVEASGAAGGEHQGVLSSSDRGPSGVLSRRRRVDSVAAMFGGLLLEKCSTFSDFSACEIESENHF